MQYKKERLRMEHRMGPLQIERYRKYLYEGEHSEATIRKYIASITGFYEALAQEKGQE